MSVSRGDFGALLDLLCTTADREFTDKQTTELVASMRELGWEGSYRVIDTLRSSASIPRNLCGVALSAIKEERKYLLKQQYQREHWKVADADKATNEEFCCMMRIIGLLCQFEHSSELLVKFGEFSDRASTQPNFVDQLRRAEVFYLEQIQQNRKLKKVETGNLL